MSIKYISHKGKQILYIDYTKCKTVEETLAVLELVKAEYEKSEGLMLTLNNFEDAYGSSEYMKKASQYGKEIFNKRTAKNAALGVTGIKKILLHGYNTIVKDKIVPFNTMEEALDYLAE